MIETFDFTTYPILETSRLKMRKLSRFDAQAIFEVRNDYQVTKYNIVDAYTNIEQARNLIRNIQSEYVERKTIRWGITVKPNDKIVGMVGFNYWDRNDHRAAIGFDLRQDHWRKSFMTEAVREVIRFGFQNMGLNRIEADASIYNVGSVMLLQNIGFTQEGIQREQYYEDGNYHDLVLFALLKREWQSEDFKL
jgi:[ribosomal protein S5]-alanine N-acetyltransferase